MKYVLKFIADGWANGELVFKAGEIYEMSNYASYNRWIVRGIAVPFQDQEVVKEEKVKEVEKPEEKVETEIEVPKDEEKPKSKKKKKSE